MINLNKSELQEKKLIIGLSFPIYQGKNLRKFISVDIIKKTMGHRTLKHQKSRISECAQKQEVFLTGAVCKAPCFWDAKRISRFSGTENCRSCERFSCAQKNLKLQKYKFLTVLRNIKFLTLQGNFYSLKAVVYFSDIKKINSPLKKLCWLVNSIQTQKSNIQNSS